MRVCPQCSLTYVEPGARKCGLDGQVLVESAHDPLIGKQVDRYRIVERIGQGGLGAVYRAQHTVLDRKVALKVLFGEFASDPTFVERFRREAMTASEMQHPNIVSVTDFGTTRENLAFIVMEFVEGETLEKLIETEAPFAPGRAAALTAQIAAGLGEAHGLGYVHRDMKPSNVMVTARSDGTEHVKLLDFGAVSFMVLPENMGRLTTRGQMVGTPLYMAPEQTLNPKVGPTADLYALGCMLYEMLTGKPPFDGVGRAEILVKHISEAPPRLQPKAGLEKLVAKLLEKVPERRVQTADEVIRSLAQLGLLGTRPPPREISTLRDAEAQSADLPGFDQRQTLNEGSLAFETTRPSAQLPSERAAADEDTEPVKRQRDPLRGGLYAGPAGGAQTNLGSARLTASWGEDGAGSAPTPVQAGALITQEDLEVDRPALSRALGKSIPSEETLKDTPVDDSVKTDDLETPPQKPALKLPIQVPAPDTLPTQLDFELPPAIAALASARSLVPSSPSRPASASVSGRSAVPVVEERADGENLLDPASMVHARATTPAPIAVPQPSPSQSRGTRVSQSVVVAPPTKDKLWFIAGVLVILALALAIAALLFV